MSVAVPTVSIAQYVGNLSAQANQLGTYAPILGRITRVLHDLGALPATGVDRPPAGFHRHKDLLRGALRKIFEEHERPDYLARHPIGYAGGCPADWEDLRVTPAGLKTLTDAERRQNLFDKESVRTLLAMEEAPEELASLFPDSLCGRLQTNPFAKDPIGQSVFAPTKDGTRQTSAIRSFTSVTSFRSFDECLLGGQTWKHIMELAGFHLRRCQFEVSEEENGGRHSVRIKTKGPEEHQISLTQERPGSLGTEIAAKAMLLGLLGSALGESWLGRTHLLTGGMKLARLEISILADPPQPEKVRVTGENVEFDVLTPSGRLAVMISLKGIAARLFPTGRYQETELPTEQQWLEACLRAMTVSLFVYTQGKSGMSVNLTETETLKFFDSTLPWSVLYTAQTFVDSLRGWSVCDRGYPQTKAI